tara:strand:+ start:308 stop:550 length:243 start_codon:yes stop_codon:yes gene_type:complete
MLALGLTVSIRGIVISPEIEDYFWEIVSAGNVTPLASGTVSNFHDTWELDSADYMPHPTASVSDEGYWDLDGTDIRPLDV